MTNLPLTPLEEAALLNEWANLHQQRRAAIDILISVREAHGPSIDVYEATLANMRRTEAAIRIIEDKLNLPDYKRLPRKDAQ